MLGGKPSLAQVENILKVSTIERKPFAFQVGGEWQGFSIDLWNKIAESLDRETIYLGHTTFQDMLKSVENGEVDLAAANISVTSARETVMDFSRPIFDSGLLILTETDGSPSMFAAFLNRKLWSWIGSAVLLFLLAGIAISVFEHRNVHFQGRGKGDRFREGFWWSVSVVTNASFTIFTPFTLAGRMLSYLLILVGLFMVSGFVAQITATLTVQELRSQVSDLNDLRGKSVGTTSASTSSRYLTSQSIQHHAYDTINEMFAALESGEVTAVIHDAPILAYYASTNGNGRYQTVGRVFNPEKLGFALPQGSLQTERINREILRLRENGEFQALVRKWFGISYQ
jgi:polar amino acid transport system substrate-binding protein